MDPPAGVVRKALLAWYRRRRRDLPWRRTQDPYRILVAEVLLQRTRVVSGGPYYERFLERFPDVRSLAHAPEEDVLRAWEGLGFYRRARNLHAAARAIAEDYGGVIPHDAVALETLPGIGPYTAGAIASIAFSERVAAVDGNATRVLARLYAIEDDVTRGPGDARIRDLARSLVPAERPGEFNQALMELGATVCHPRAPDCCRCPLEACCLARRRGIEVSLPRRPRARQMITVPVVFALLESKGRVLLIPRPPGGLLAGLWSLPGGEKPLRTDDREILVATVLAQTGLRTQVGPRVTRINQMFSHRRWAGAIYRCEPMNPEGIAPPARWVDRGELASLPVVPAHRKTIEAEARLASIGPPHS